MVNAVGGVSKRRKKKQGGGINRMHDLNVIIVSLSLSHFLLLSIVILLLPLSIERGKEREGQITK